MQEVDAVIAQGLTCLFLLLTFRLFANMENLGDIRQTRYEPLVRRQRAPDGRWTVNAWAPLDGRVISRGVLVSF